MSPDTTILDGFGNASAPGALALADGSRVAVVGGGPAGSFFSRFLLRLADTADLDIEVDIYEPREFRCSGPAGCNHCGGVISESLVQILATEGLNLPERVVQRGIDSYMLHTDVGSVRIATPLHEKRIASVYRGNGPRDVPLPEADSGFDRFLLDLAIEAGARIQPRMVTDIAWAGSGATVTRDDGKNLPYDLVAVATGINSSLAQRLAQRGMDMPQAMKTFICEFHLGEDIVAETLGSSMHVFFLDIPRLMFAALIPKGEFATLCMLGKDIDAKLVQSFLDAPEVRACFPEDSVPKSVCHCFPRINIRGVREPYDDRLVLIGDCGVSRLYKDGIGAAYRTAKAAATTAVLHGVAKADFAAHYRPACRSINRDNAIGKFMFDCGDIVKYLKFARRTVLQMTKHEQRSGGTQRLSSILWDLCTGSAPYQDAFWASFHPAFIVQLIRHLVTANLAPGRTNKDPKDSS